MYIKTIWMQCILLLAAVAANSQSATGGTVVTSGNYRYHIFTTTGANTLDVQSGGTIEVFLVGGGGGGGGTCGGGGGAGGVIGFTQVAVGPGQMTVTVGDGGGGGGGWSTSTTHQGLKGGNSVFGGLTAYGGGGGADGGGGPQAFSSALGDGGSGGGSAGWAYAGQGVTGQASPPGQGNNGGANGFPDYGAGGGGAGAQGTSPQAGSVPANGGAGNYNADLAALGLGSPAGWFGGGGGGGNNSTPWFNNTTPAEVYTYYSGGGGNGGGGNGSGLAYPAANTVAAVQNTGGGGGGAGFEYGTSGTIAGGNGGSGIVVVRYQVGGTTSQPPAITSNTSVNFTQYTAASYTVLASNNPTSFGMTGTLPTGMTFSGASLTGTPTAPGTYNLTISATNGSGTGTAALAITVTAAAPVFPQGAAYNGTVGSQVNYTVSATYADANSYSATNLPTGVSMNNQGAMTGAPQVAGTYIVGLGATNNGVTGSGTLTMNISAAAPAGSYLPLTGGTLSGSLGIGIGTTPPRAALDLGNTGTAMLKEIHFVSDDYGYGGDNSDPYTLRKVHDAANTSHLDLNLNDDADESFRIYGYSCAGYGCGTYSGNLYHSFDASGNAYHRTSLAVGVTAPPSGYMFAVAGNAIVQKLVVKQQQNWPDYVFDSSFRLRTLPSLEAYIARNRHLPDMPSAAEVKKGGIDLGGNQAALLKKIEELTLYTIQQQKLIQEQRQALDEEKRLSAEQERRFSELGAVLGGKSVHQKGKAAKGRAGH